jgi:putative phosphoribosyl transferase
VRLPFRDRAEAGRRLARLLDNYRGSPDVVVLGLPRGGVPVAFEVARELEALLDVFLVRKLGVPGQEELALGAIASGGMRVLNEHLTRSLGISEKELDEITAQEERELLRQEQAYRGDRSPPTIKGKTVILVDDGLATGATARAAALALRELDPLEVVIAVPVGPPDTVEELENEADRVVCLAIPQPFMAVGTWYEDFHAPSDQEVRDLLSGSNGRPREH